MFPVLIAVFISAFTVAYLCLSGSKSAVANKVKYAVSLAYIRWRKRKLGLLFNFDCDSADVRETGVVPPPEAWRVESPRPLSSHTQASDTVSVSGSHQNGTVLMTRMTRRHDRRTDVWVYLRLPSGEEYALPGLPDSSVYNTDGRSFSAAGLKLEVQEPLFRWQVSFNGYLREIVNGGKADDDSKVVLVSFSFIWHPSCSHVTFPHDFSATYMAELLSKRDWLKENFEPPWTECSEESLEQFGELHGTLKIEGEQEQRVLLRGLKSRRHGVLDWSNVKKRIAIHGVARNGATFHLFFDDTKIGHKNFFYGYVVPPCNMTVHHISTVCDIDILKAFDRVPGNKNELYLSFKTEDKDYSFEFTWEDTEIRSYGGESWESEITIQPIAVQLNGIQGDAILEFARPNCNTYPPAQARSLPLLHEPVLVNGTKKLIVSFDEIESRCGKLVGGKGSSLALMASLRSPNFVVPKGISVTNNAYELHLAENGDIRKALRKLIGVAWNRKEGILSEECDSLVELVKTTKIPLKVKLELEVKLQDTFGESFEDLKFAVRSSAIGEDGEDTSAAGQNETFLGVRGLKKICASIASCWASQFAFRSIEYKRQNGQLLDAGMGVVIQQMVAPDSAGVLFSRDPLTGSVASIAVTSNYGLGESVVSASADPDTITLKRWWNDHVTIDHRQLGAKRTMITMSDDSETGTGTREEEVEAALAIRSSLSDEDALRLGSIALDLEKRFGSARDIEWAIRDGTIYMLQSRPVTADGNLTDFEIIHEFDSTTRTDDDSFTVANVGEVHPGALTAIALTIFRAQNCYFQKKFSWKVDRFRFDPTGQNAIVQFYGHLFMDLIAQKLFSLEPEKSSMNKALDIGVFGRVLDDDAVLQQALQRYENPSQKTKFGIILMTLKGFFFGKRLLKKAAKKYVDYPVTSLGAVTAHDAYENISKCIWDIHEITEAHYSASLASLIWNLVTLNMLSQGSGEFGLDQYADFANLVGSAIGAESGEVPFSLQEMIKVLLKEIAVEDLLKMTPEDLLSWLQSNKSDAGVKFREFITKHGHRGLKEFDIGCSSWGMHPVEVATILQTMAKNSSALKSSGNFSTENAIDNLKSQLTPFKKRLLRWVMKGCRNGVVQREKSKSMLVKYVNGLRRGYRHLGELMAQEGLIPDAKLVIFLTHEELGRILENRSAKLIRRAQHRRRMFAYKDRLQFPEMSDVFPIPIQDMKTPELDGTSMVKGYPVSQGVVEAPARVVLSFHDIGTIQPGEILITFSTDIGWSPYFPMLAGVVTEIGGLVSHGAVVAREFGLPCLVGAQGASKVFKSGDKVLLDATKGFICKVE